MLNHTANKILLNDFLLNVDMLECIRRGSAEILFASDGSVLLIDIPSQIYMLSSQSHKIAEHLISKISANAEIIVSHDKFSYELLAKKFKFNNTMICYNTVYTNHTPLESKNSTVNIKILTLGYKDIIMKYYSKAEIIEEGYIEDRLKSKVMFGAFINDDLCGFIGSHTEGSIGMLEVIPNYRGKGIGAALQIAATNSALANGRYPYGQVIEDNLASAALQKKLGFELSKNKVYWLMK
ncbi:GCN5-related N-acetyltransferase [Clostridium sp. DL-VIII]|uniref:GNAT family N-acetyltransferase n=1 Tax=Clostridium sp. DL-VIII TaxID=641107 RepID=UPI00023AF923|nr:GNAT family N-acetyltransferase [Clostridium sp. DL-VIII]EHI99297.1 GCN5-related N-acetyltransferase [Clostridium sp. DL-VIII]